MAIRVKAKTRGRYDYRIREPGEVFEIADEKAFSKIWMERVEKPEAKAGAAPEKPKA